MMKTQKTRTTSVVLLSILCVILTIVLGALLLTAMSARRTAKDHLLTAAVEKLPLQEINIDNSSMAQYILDEFVADERVSVENVERVMKDGTFTQYAAQLVETYNQYLLGEGDFPQIQPEDIVKLVEENQALILNETGLEFLDPDKQKLIDALSTPMEFFNKAVKRSMHSGISGFATRSMFSVWLQIVLGILLLAVMVWMIVFYVRGGFRAGTALKVYSIALFIPCAVMLLGLFILQMAAGMNIPYLTETLGVFNASLMPLAGIGAAVCAVIFVVGMICNMIAGKKQPVPVEEMSNGAEEPDYSESMPQKDEEEVHFEEPEPEAKRQFCRNCGKPLVNPDAKFCYKCGNVQEHVNTEE